MKNPFLLFLFFGIHTAFAQQTELFKNDNAVISYTMSATTVTIILEDLQPATTSPLGRQAKFDEESDIDNCIVEFDKNNDGKVNKGDLGFQFKGLENQVYFSRSGGRYGPGLGKCNYFLYEGFPGVFMNNLSRGCDNKASKALLTGKLETSPASSEDHSVWKLTIPLKELANPNSKEVHLRVKMYRSYGKQVFEYPSAFDYTSFSGLTLPLGNYDVTSALQKEKAQANNALNQQSQKQYRAKMDYDGVYIDMGNGKFAELMEVSANNGMIVTTMGKQQTHYYGRPGFVSTLESMVVVPKVKKIIFKGGNFDSPFFDGLYISQLENINELGLTKDMGGRTDDVKILALAGLFGGSPSFKSEQPDVLYTPIIEKENFANYLTYETNKKTISRLVNEVYLSETLSSGMYVMFQGNRFWLFKIP